VVERSPFGRTGHDSSRVVFGAAGLWSVTPEAAAGVLELLHRYGVNHIDTAAAYGDSELRVGEWMTGHRDEFFLATKTGERDGDAARRSLERSLTRLQVDHVDLVQLHNLVEEDEWAQAFAPGGAVEALAQARDEGLTRFLGVTGHGLRIAAMHRRSLERFDFDSVLLPYSAALLRDAGFAEDVDELLALCADRQVAVQTIKAVARRRWPADHDGPRYSWYEPMPAGPELRRAVAFVLCRHRLFLNSSSDLRLLEPTLRAAEAAAQGPAPEPAEIADDMARLAVQPIFDGGALERI